MTFKYALPAIIGAAALYSVSAQATPAPGAQSVTTVEPAIVLVQSTNQQKLQKYEEEGRRALEQGNRGTFR